MTKLILCWVHLMGLSRGVKVLREFAAHGLHSSPPGLRSRQFSDMLLFEVAVLKRWFRSWRVAHQRLCALPRSRTEILLDKLLAVKEVELRPCTIHEFSEGAVEPAPTLARFRLEPPRLAQLPVGAEEPRAEAEEPRAEAVDPKFVESRAKTEKSAVEPQVVATTHVVAEPQEVGVLLRVRCASSDDGDYADCSLSSSEDFTDIDSVVSF
jgi:hypothetical protein